MSKREQAVAGPAVGSAGLSPALADVYRDHFDFVWRSLLRLGVPSSQAEDVAQDVFLVVHRRLPDYDSARALRPWLFGIARRVAADRRRSSQREQRRMRVIAAAGSDRRADPEQAAARAEAAQIVQGFLDSLDEERRVVFVLGELEGFSGTEIAQALDINRNTVYTRLRAARRLFAEWVRDRTRPPALKDRRS